MKLAWLGSLALIGCTDRSIEWDRGGGNQPVKEVPAPQNKQIASDPCFRRDGDVWVFVGWRNCVDLLPAQKMRGVWIRAHEESSFIPGAPAIPAANNPVRFRVLLEAETQAVERLPEPSDRGKSGSHVYAIEFIGRRSRHAGEYYSGKGDHVVVLDDLIAADYLGPAPKPDFEAAAEESRRLGLERPLNDGNGNRERL